MDKKLSVCINGVEILDIIQKNIDAFGCYDYFTANEIIKDILSKVNIDAKEIDFAPKPMSIDHIHSSDDYAYSILDKKEGTLVLLVLETYHWFDYYKDKDKIEIVKEIPKIYDKNESYYSSDNPVNTNDKFIYNNELYIVDRYQYHSMDIIASKVVRVIEISAKDLVYDFHNGVYYFSYEEYCENIMNEMNDENNF